MSNLSSIKRFRTLSRRPVLLALVIFGAVVYACFRKYEPRTYLPHYHATCVLGVVLDEGNRADAVLLSYFSRSGVRILVVPRDTDCAGGHKLNAMYKRLGRKGFIELVSGIAGHPIKKHIVVSLKEIPGLLRTAFPRGLQLRNPYRLRYRDHAGGFSYDIPRGQRVLTAEELVWYLRDRYSDPMGRGERAMVERWAIFVRSAAKELCTVAGLPRLLAVFGSSRQALSTNLMLSDILSLALSYRRTGMMSIEYLPGRPYVAGGVAFVELDEQACRRRARLALLGVVPPDSLRVWVLNGTSRPRLAHRTAERIERDLGLECHTGNGKSAWEPRTTVEYSPVELKPMAELVAEYLQAPRLLVTPYVGDTPKPVILVTVGRDMQEHAQE